jgi:hypothetical protein
LIVVSGALCLVALVLLILGLVVSSGLTLIYASIGVSLISFVFLFLGVRQRRPATVTGVALQPAALPVAAPGSRPVAAQPAGELGAETDTEADAETNAEVTRVVPAGELGGPLGRSGVFVVPGRPRYHADGCRFLAGRETQQMGVTEARAAGYKACAVCRVDEVVAEAVAPPAPAAADRRPAAARRAAAAARNGPTPRSAARQAAPPTTPSAAGGQTGEPDAAGGASPRTRAQPTVFVIPDRGRYHKAECRYVRGVAEATEIPKAAARRQGYQPCGVCRP